MSGRQVCKYTTIKQCDDIIEVHIFKTNLEPRREGSQVCLTEEKEAFSS